MSANAPDALSSAQSRPSRRTPGQSEPSRDVDDQSPNPPSDRPGAKRPREKTPPPKLYASADHLTQTPRSYKMSSMDRFSSQIRRQEQLNIQFGRESSGRFLGPMRVEDFLKTFLPPKENFPFPERIGFKALSGLKGEDAMYRPFIAAAKEYTGEVLIYRDTHSDPDAHCDGLKPDLSAYDSDEKEMQARENGTDFTRMDHFIELKSQSKDPFHDPPPSKKERQGHAFERVADHALKARGQICSYLAALNRCQFRTHAYCVCIVGYNARLIRWDPAGVIVTQLFNFTDTDYMGEFYWRYSHLTREQRGYDQSVTPASAEERAKMTEEAEEFLKKQNTVDKGASGEAKSIHRAFYKINIPDRKNSNIQHPHVISYPLLYERQSPFGRMTKTMIAFDLEKQVYVFVKDYWRSTMPGMEKEGDVYATLQEHKVPNIATFAHGNDVSDASTFNQTLQQADWACDSRDCGPLQLYRMSLLEIGDALHHFKSSKEFVLAIKDAMEAHDAAAFIAGILHRDISVGNVIIYNGKGLLIDWDLCIRMAKRKEQPTGRRADGTGTWQFMSAKILSDRGHLHDVIDDRESAYHVITWLALRYTEHNQLPFLHHYLAHFDYGITPIGGGSVVGGHAKKHAFSELTGALAIRYKDSRDQDRKRLQEQEEELKNLESEFKSKIEKLDKEIEDAPSSSVKDIIRRVKQDIEGVMIARRNDKLKARDSNPVVLMPKQLKGMGEREWLVDILRRHLAQDDWTTDDVAKSNPVPPRDQALAGQDSRRESQQGRPVPVTKRQKMLDGTMPRRSGSSGVLTPDTVVDGTGVGTVET